MRRILPGRPAALLAAASLFFAPSAVSAEQTRYRFTPSSSIGFDAKSTLHPFSGRTQRVEGDFCIDWENLPLSKGGFLDIAAETLDTGNGMRDKKMKGEHLQTNRYPRIRFESTGCVGLYQPGREEGNRAILTGRLDLHGVSRPIEIPVTLSRSENDRLKISGKIPLRLGDYRIPVPSVIGLIKMEEEVVVTFNLDAEPEGESR